MKDRIEFIPPIGPLTKGLPFSSNGLNSGEVGSRKWNVLRGDLPLPLAVLRRSALERNESWMRAFRERTGILMAPHGKTTMSPQLFRSQLDAGCWAITVATVHQMRVCRHFGIQRIVLANQLIGRQEIEYVLSELRDDPDLEFYCLIDSVRGVELLDEGAARINPGRRLNLLLEGGTDGGRTGCRSLDDAMEVARAVRNRSRLALRGVEGFEGLDADASEESIAAFIRYLVEIARTCDREDLFGEGPVLLSAGGSAYFDIVVDVFSRAELRRPMQIVTRSGCYIAHDSIMYTKAMERILRRSPGLAELGSPLQPALEVWAYVQSRPERSKAILTMGKRDVSHDAGLPIPIHWFRPTRDTAPAPLADGHIVTGLNDQHAHMALPTDSPLEVGDMVGFGISHPCTTFDKWQTLFVVDDSYTVVDGLRTFF